MPTVFITGGAVRIGRRLAVRFAERGWNVGITFNTSEEEADRTVRALLDLGVRAAAVQCDVQYEDRLDGALDLLASTLGIPEVIVSNAGVFPDRRNVHELTADALRRTLNVNTIPLLTLARWLDRRRSEGTVRRLVSLSSLGGIEIWRDRIDYNVSKSALITLVKSLARGLAPFITVNSVAPGAITADLESTDADAAVAPLQKIPMSRYGAADDVFDTVWFLATSTTYITGQTIVVDGGAHLTK